jgi:K+-sensing histidine kinase KdpD
MTLDPARGGAFTPWFRRRSRLAVTTAAALFVAVFAIRWALPEEEAVTALYVFPISLVAMARGLRAGLVAAAVALLLMALGVLVTDATLSTTGWLVRIATLLAVGALLGSAADNLSRAEQQRQLSALSAQRQRQAVEINDTLIQGMAAAKWAMEAGQVDAGLATLTDTIVLGQDLVSELIRENDLGWHTFTTETGSSAGLQDDLGSRDTA